MNYTIGELSKIMNVSIHTLRYYDNEGLLPFVQRKPNGQRIFTHRICNLLLQVFSAFVLFVLLR